MISLRPYQCAGIEAIRRAFAAGKRAPLYVLPTGGGKTVMFAHVAHGAAAKGNRVLILSHRIELVDQISDALTASDTSHGFIAAGYPDTPAACMIASVPTLLRRLERVPEPALIVVDEAHHSRSKTWTAILERWPHARRLGVTATPVRASGEGLGTLFDDLILGPTVAELTALGHLAPVRVFAPETVDTSGLHVHSGDYQTAESEQLMDKPAIIGSALAHYEALARGLPAIVFCVSVSHAEHVAEQFRAAGHPAVALNGGTERGIRRGVVADFKAGKIRVLVGADLFNEGFDSGGIQVGIMLRPTQSLGLHCQQLGRVLRPAPGKERALILDHVGNTSRLGLPDTEREWTLAGQDRKRNAAKTQAVKICPACYCAMPPTAQTCPECKHVFTGKPREVEEREGELHEVTPEEVARRQARREQGRSDTLEALIELGRQRGYGKAEAWARHVWEARQRRRAGAA